MILEMCFTTTKLGKILLAGFLIYRTFVPLGGEKILIGKEEMN
jgi:ATP-dependent DNA helicase 2 subunit 1